MKNRIVSLTLSTLFGTCLAVALPVAGQTGDAPQAQEQGTQGQRHEADPARQVRLLSKRLNLSADQQKQILPILNDRLQQSQAIRSDSSLSPKDRHAKLRDLRQDTEGKIEAVLNADQKQAYVQMRQQAEERGRQNRQNSGGGAGNSN